MHEWWKRKKKESAQYNSKRVSGVWIEIKK